MLSPLPCTLLKISFRKGSLQWGCHLVNPAAGRQHRRIGAETPYRRFPHLVRGRVEDQVEVDVTQEPERVRQFVVELSGAPAGVAGDDPRARRRARFEDLAQERLRGRQKQTITYEFEVLRRSIA